MGDELITLWEVAEQAASEDHLVPVRVVEDPDRVLADWAGRVIEVSAPVAWYGRGDRAEVTVMTGLSSWKRLSREQAERVRVVVSTEPVLVNLTPHAIDVVDPESGAVVASLPPEPEPARAEMTRERVGTLEVNGASIPVTRNRLGAPSELPEPAPGRYYIVSRVYVEAARAHGDDRTDLLIPDDPVRDGEGRIVGCRGFAVVE